MCLLALADPKLKYTGRYELGTPLRDAQKLIGLLPRDAMHKGGLCCRPLSARLSVMLVYCSQTAEAIVKLLSRPGSPMMLVFDPRRRHP